MTQIQIINKIKEVKKLQKNGEITILRSEKRLETLNRLLIKIKS